MLCIFGLIESIAATTSESFMNNFIHHKSGRMNTKINKHNTTNTIKYVYLQKHNGRPYISCSLKRYKQYPNLIMEL